MALEFLIFGVMKKRWLIVMTLNLMGMASWAQCAMCRATAESVTEHVDKGIGEGLNTGIVYLMLVPYVIMVTLAVVFFKKKWMTWFKGAPIN